MRYWAPMTMRVICRAFLAILLCLSAVGCGPALTAVRPEVQAPSLARVQLRVIEDNIFKFTVYNLSDRSMVILRDEVVLITRSGPRHRLPGGLENVYNVAPGQSHAVNTRFDLTGCEPGDELKVDFTPAIQIQGQATPIDPILVRVD